MILKLFLMISIHSLHTEGDPDTGNDIVCATIFQSTPSTRRETETARIVRATHRHFNPLPPHGGRLDLPGQITWLIEFQSTPSTRRETNLHSGKCIRYRHFNPLPPHGGRLLEVPESMFLENFNPLPPHGGRPENGGCIRYACAFQSTPSTRRETITNIDVDTYYNISIHSLHTEGDFIIPQHIHI